MDPKLETILKHRDSRPANRLERGWAHLVAALAVVAAAWASPAAADVRCDSTAPGATCRIVAAGGLVFETARANLVDPSDPDGVQVDGDMVLVAAGLELPFEDSQAYFERSARGDLWMQYAQVRAPWHSLPILQDIEYPGELPLVMLGMAQTEELRELFEDPKDPATRLPLAENPVPGRPGEIADPVYLFFSMETGDELAVPLPLPAEVTGGGAPPSIPLASRQVVSIIIDPADPYVYFSNEGGGGLAKKLEDKAWKKLEEHQEKKRKEQEAAEKAEKKDEKKKTAKKKKNKREPAKKKQKDAEKKDDDRKAEKSNDRKSKKDKKKNDKKKRKDRKLPKGTFAFSARGGIPADAGMPGDLGHGELALDGHLFIRNPTPIGPFIEMNGPTISHFGDDGFAIWGGGEAEVTLPFIGDLVSFSFPLGHTTAAFEAGEEGASARFSGLLAPDAEFLPDLVPIKQAGSLAVDGVISSRLVENSVRAEGQLGLDLSGLGKLVGVKLGDVMSVQGKLTMDAGGFHLVGISRTRIPGVNFNGDLFVEAHFPGNPAEAYVKIVGDLGVAGIGLGAGASLEIDRTGAFVSGKYRLGGSFVALSGQITSKGPRLTGSTRVVIDLAAIQKGLDDARAEVERAQAEIAKIDLAIPLMREQVRADRRRDSQALRDAQAVVNVAKAKVSGIQKDIDTNNGLISRYRREIGSWKRKSCKWYDAPCAAERAGAIAWRETKIKGLQAANVTLVATRATAQAALDAAIVSLRGVEAGLDALPTDADPRIVALFAARESAEVALKAAEATLASIPQLPNAELVARATLTLGVDGLRGRLSVETGGIDVASGRVALGASPKACVTIAGFGEACAPF